MDPARHRRLSELAERFRREGRSALADEPAADLAELDAILAEAALESEAPIVDHLAIEAIASAIGGRPDAPQIPGYRLERMLGHGAHADVWEGRETSALRRRVAVKVLASRATADRFDFERESLALMSHPGITKVFAADTTPDGRPYLVMEHLEGQPFVHGCERRGLGLRVRVRLLVDVCRAVQHAHDRGVMHRDLKPSNILVVDTDEGPAAKVIDFGIAKALAAAPRGGSARGDATCDGQIVGTPAYMSPEQLSGNPSRVDVRSDVYGLGSVLFEAITGRQRWDVDGLTLLAAVRTVVEMPPRRAEALAPEARGDLGAVLERALAGDPAERYPSVAALADDLERWLRGEPVHAVRAPVHRRLAWFARQHRVAAGIVAGTAIGLLGLGIGAIWLVMAQRAENARLREWCATATQAIAQLADVPGSIESRDQLSALVVSQFARLPMSGDPRALGLYADALRRRGDILRERGEITESLVVREQALEAAQQALALDREDPKSWRRLAVMTVLVGDAARESGDHATALGRYLEAHEIYHRFASPPDQPAAKAGSPQENAFDIPLVWSHDRLADTYCADPSTFPQALIHARLMLSLAERLMAGGESVERLQAMIAARCRVVFATRRCGQQIDALPLMDRSVEDATRLVAIAPDNKIYQQLLITVLRDAGGEYGVDGQPGKGAMLLRQAINHARHLALTEPTYLDVWCRLAESRCALAALLLREGDLEGAKVEALQAQHEAGRAYDLQPSNPAYSGVILEINGILSSIDLTQAAAGIR